MTTPKLFDPAVCRTWTDQQLLAVAVALGFNARQAALDFMAGVKQEVFDDYWICRPEPYNGNGPPPKPIKVKTKAELFAIARQAAAGKFPNTFGPGTIEDIYPHFRRDCRRRLSQAESNEVAEILRNKDADRRLARDSQAWIRGAAERRRLARVAGVPTEVGIPTQ